MNLEIRNVRTRRDLRAFHDVRRQIYANDPHAIRPLDFQLRYPLDERRNPFYEHAERELFLCLDEGRPVGRVAAIVDHLHQQQYQDRTGFFGFFECPNRPEISAWLLDAAAAYLKSRNCDTIRGPVNPSMKGEFGVLVEGNDQAPYVMTAHTPEYYDGLLKQDGFAAIESFVAFHYLRNAARDIELNAWANVEKICQRVERRCPGLRVSHPSRTDLESTLAQVNRMANQVRQEVFGFVPITQRELDALVKQMRRIIRPEMVILVHHEQDLAGYSIAIPDMNWVVNQCRGPFDWIRMLQIPYWIKRCVRARAVAYGAVEKYRHMGVAALLIKRLFDIGERQFNDWEFSWFAKSNTKSIKAIQRMFLVDSAKKWKLYQRPIS